MNHSVHAGTGISNERLAHVGAPTRVFGALGAVLLLPLVFGLVHGFLVPRGPVTAGQALWSMVLSVLVGLATGYRSGSRLSLLAGPLVYVLAFEVARLASVGPTVDLPLGGGIYGLIAFVTGRLFAAFLTIVPLVTGTLVGLGLAARAGGAAGNGIGVGGWLAAAALAVGLVALGAVIARPAYTAPIVGPDGGPLAGSVAELADVVIGGREQALLIRGRDAGNPVLLYLAGGPGGTDIGAARRDASLEQDFVVVTWDQRGAGKSYTAIDPTGALTVRRLMDDTVEVTDYLRTRFSVDKVYLVGQSWGSTLAVLVAQEHPELFHAVVGVGQMVSQRATDQLFWEDALAWAEANGNTGLAARLRRNGAPPYRDVMAYVPVVTTEHDWNAYPGFDGSNEMPASLLVPEYSLIDKVNAFRGFLDSAAVLYPQLQEIDFRVDVRELALPYLMVLGGHEARGRAVLAEEWFGGLEAPAKRSVVFEEAGHRANFDQPGRFAEVMRQLKGSVP